LATSHRSKITLAAVCGAVALIACSAAASAQRRPAEVQCRKTETQAECHARLQCKASEDLEDCQRRLLKCRADEDLERCEQRVEAARSNERGDGRRDDEDGRGRDRDDRRDRRGRDDRDDRGGRDDRGDRGGRDDRGDVDRSDRGRRDRGDSSRRRSQRGGRGRDAAGFTANKTFGLGLELGEPSGLTGKYFLSDAAALDFGLGWIYRHYYYGDGVHLYGDFLWHPTSLVSSDAFELPFYVGVGLRFWDFEYCDDRVCGYGGSALGIRVPFGIAFDFNNAPLDIFIQLVPVLDFVSGDYYDRRRNRAHFGVDLSVGIRFWFN
jgi:hypothetical protein